jgi:hypothetical protein
LLSLREKGLLIQALPLDFPVHLTSLVIMCWSGPGKKISLSQLGKTFPGTAGHGHSCLNHKEWMNLSHEGKEVPLPDQKEQWTMNTHPGCTRMTIKRLKWKDSFSFIWEMYLSSV